MRLLVKDIGKQKVYIGFRGEQNYAEIAFDFSNIFAEYPDADVAMRIKPPEGETYPHSLTREENIVVWHVSASDCATAGMGSYQVTFTSGNTIVKSFVGLYVVRESLDVTGDPPDPYVSWLEELEEIATDVHHEIEDAKETMSGYLEESEDARDTAVASAETAVAANESAQAAAQTANTKAFEATEAARTATSKANEANVSAMMAENYKTTAVNAASQAASAANTAMQSATVATTKATEAANSAASALNSKTVAETSAATASQASAAAVAANTEVQEAKEIVVAAKDTTVAAKDRVEELVESLPDDFDALVEDVAKLKTDVGDTTELETEAKSDLVSAINEVHGDLSGKADLENGKVPAAQLPSYVDDVLEYSSFSAFPVTGEFGKIYVALDTNNVYRWSGSTYIQINDVLELIDDEAGLGDTDKAWSADKITHELDNLDPTLTESIESTAVAVFDDGADDLPLEELRVEINPVQDLHGYDKPWVGGAGANLIPDGIDTTNGFVDNKYLGSSGSTYSSEAYYVSEFFPVTAGQVYTMSNSGNAMNSQAMAFYDSSKAYISGQNFGNQTVRQVTAPENAVYARCTQSKDFSSRLIQFEKGDTATTPTPYKNICPITGWDGVEVTRTGKNLCEGKITGVSIKSSGIIGTDASYSMFIAQVKEGETYCVTKEEVALVCGFFTSKPASGSTSYNSSRTVIAEANTFIAPIDGWVAVRSTAADVNVQIEMGSTPTAYEAFTGNNVYPIQFPSEAGTVYSGYLTVHKDGTGEVVADSAQVDLTGKIFATTQQTSSSGRFSFSVGNNPTTMPNPLDRNAEIISSHYKGIVESEIDLTSPWVFCASDSVVVIQTADTSLDTGTKLGAFLTAQSNAGTPVTICYKVKTPIHFPLTTTQVRTLLGYNAISADSGNVALTYRKDSEVNYELARLEEKIDSRPEIINDETVADDSVWSSEKVDHLTTTEQETVSGDIVTFETDAEQLLENLTVSMAPVQDLHGYDAPWVGGAGKNLLEVGNVTPPTGITCTNNNGEVIINGRNESSSATWVYGEVYLEPGDYIFSGAYGNPDFYTDAITSSNRMYIVVDGVNVFDMEAGGKQFTVTTAGIYKPRIVFVGATSAGNRTFTNSKIYPMIRRAGTTSDWEPYKNICPITGWDGVEVTRTGKNWYNSATAELTANWNIDADGTDTSKNNRSATKGYIRVKPETTYAISYAETAMRNGVFFYKADKTFISFVSWGALGRTVDTPAETAYIRMSFDSGTPPTNVQVEEGSTATAYEDSAQTYSISFPTSAGTVYGGTLTINRDGSGSLVVDRQIYELDQCEIHSVTAYAGQDFYGVRYSNLLNNTNVRSITGKSSSHFQFIPFASTGNATKIGQIQCVNSSSKALFITTYLSTAEEWTAYLAAQRTAGTPVTVCIDMTTPQTYSLTANQVRTLLGYNAIWANSGNVSVKYRKGSLADLTSMTNVESRTLSTLSMLAPIEFSPATSAHAVGDVFIVGDKLYMATAAIAQGAVIAEGTNVTQTTIMTALQNASGVSF